MKILHLLLSISAANASVCNIDIYLPIDILDYVTGIGNEIA